MEQPAADTRTISFSCLVVDDSDFARMNAKKIVSNSGGKVVGEAKDGKKAVELYSELRPDLVLLDITMPVQDGIDALSRIMELNSEAKVVIVSSLGNKEMVKKALSIGAKHFITKPFNPEYVAEIIRSVIGPEKEA